MFILLCMCVHLFVYLSTFNFFYFNLPFTFTSSLHLLISPNISWCQSFFTVFTPFFLYFLQISFTPPSFTTSRRCWHTHVLFASPYWHGVTQRNSERPRTVQVPYRTLPCHRCNCLTPVVSIIEWFESVLLIDLPAQAYNVRYLASNHSMLYNHHPFPTHMNADVQTPLPLPLYPLSAFLLSPSTSPPPILFIPPHTYHSLTPLLLSPSIPPPHFSPLPPP